MTDTNPSGASFAPAADIKAPAASAETPAGNFGSTRGSGLARGKRQSSAAAPTASTAKSDYKPIALEVITPASEYKNPFASPVAESAPAAEPANVETAEAPVAEAPVAVAPVAAAVTPEAVVASAPLVVPEAEPEKREIHILPPAESIRPAFNWESPSVSRNASQPPERGERAQIDERPTFRPDRREDSADDPRPEPSPARLDGGNPRNASFQRQPRDPREARQPRDPRDARQPRDPRDERQPRDPRFERQPRDPRDERPRYDQRPQGEPSGSAEPVAPASGGFFGWLKSFFGGSKPAAEVPPAREFGGERQADGQRPRRRHRGGRGHGGSPQGFRGENAQGFRGDRPYQGGPRPEGQPGGEGEGRGDRHNGPRRRRSRGGPGRDRGGEPRAEGHQGGGAI